jgi:hypothetical protein
LRTLDLLSCALPCASNESARDAHEQMTIEC